MGRLISSHGTAPSILQRAVVVTILSFFFFVATLLIFYLRQQVIYFVLSTAFLVVYIFTMIGWVMQKRNLVSIYENGVTYKKFSSTWDEMKSVRADKNGIELVKASGEKAMIGKTIADFERIAVMIRERLP